MSGISNVAAYAAANQARPIEATEAKETRQADEAKKSKVRGKTIGNPKLTDKAAKYYEELRKKHPDKEFILVSEDQKEMAKAQAGMYANPMKMVVLIDEDKLERMAADEDYRKHYESIINNASSDMNRLKNSLSSTGANVKGYGMQVDDKGIASFFAVVDKSYAAQRERMAEKAVEKRKAKKAEAKKAAKEKRQEWLEEARAKRRDRDNKLKEYLSRPEDLETITATSVEELIHKVEDSVLAGMSDRAQTEAERKVGRNIDYSA